MPTPRTPRRENSSYALSRMRCRAGDPSSMSSASVTGRTITGCGEADPPRSILRICDSGTHERRDSLLPRLKRLRRTGRESRGRAARQRIRRVDPRRGSEPIRRGPRRRARLLEAARAPLPQPGRSARALAGLTAATTLLSGCGDGRLSHDEFVKRADAICSAYRASTERLAHPRTYADVLAYVKKTLPVYEAALRKLEELQPPNEDELSVRLWLAADRRIVKAQQKLADAALRRDYPDVVAAANEVQSAGVDARAAAVDLGLHVCARA